MEDRAEPSIHQSTKAIHVGAIGVWSHNEAIRSETDEVAHNFACASFVRIVRTQNAWGVASTLKAYKLVATRSQCFIPTLEGMTTVWKRIVPYYPAGRTLRS
jgi:hypothetical protein